VAYPYVFDVRNADRIAKAVEDAKNLMGGLDGIMLVVGISRGLPLHKITKDSWDDEFGVNVRSHMLFAQKALQTMDPGAAIVIISSMAGQRTGTNPTYETSKAAQVALARAIARIGEPKGIRANVIAPVSRPWIKLVEILELTSTRDMLILQWVEMLLDIAKEGLTWFRLADKRRGMLFLIPP